jgi:pseudouridine synthase
MRIQKHFSEQNILSRRETERYILEGRIAVNGKVVTNLGTQIDPAKDVVEIIENSSKRRKGVRKSNKSPITEEKITVAFNKPRGISSSKIKSEGKNIFDLVPQFSHLNTIGRLDKESEGLILLSNDGVITNIITGENYSVEKEYIVDVKEKITQTKIKALSQGMMLEDGPTLPTRAKLLGDHTFSIVLTEGRNHQIRRMAAKINLTVARLKRIRVGAIRLGSIKSGAFKILADQEIRKLKTGR